MMKDSAEARLGGMIEQSLLKKKYQACVWTNAAAPWCSQILANSAQCFALCSTKNSLEPSILVTIPLSLSVRAFLKSLCLYLPTSSNWSLWQTDGPSIQWVKRSWLVSLLISHTYTTNSAAVPSWSLYPKKSRMVSLSFYGNVNIKTSPTIWHEGHTQFSYFIMALPSASL